jgi:hypothetical protein
VVSDEESRLSVPKLRSSDEKDGRDLQCRDMVTRGVMGCGNGMAFLLTGSRVEFRQVGNRRTENESGSRATFYVWCYSDGLDSETSAGIDCGSFTKPTLIP